MVLAHCSVSKTEILWIEMVKWLFYSLSAVLPLCIRSLAPGLLIVQ